MSSKLPFLDGWFYFPINFFPNLNELKSDLTVESKFKISMSGKEAKTTFCFDENTHEGFIGIPSRYGFEQLKKRYGTDYKAYFVDRSSIGTKRITTPKQPDLNHKNASVGQKETVSRLIEALRNERFVMLKAGCGTGKTPMALSIIAQTKLKTIIFVDTELLKVQMLKEIEDKLGILKEDVGIIQGNKCQVDKDITIAMSKTVASGKYKDKMRDQFGLAIYDEIQVLGAEMMCQVMGQANNWCALAMTATDNRADGRDKTYKLFFGEPQVTIEAPSLPAKVIVLGYKKPIPDWAKSNTTSKILAISRDKEFNQNVGELAYSLYKDNRNILIVSNHIKPLKAMYDHAVKLGIPKEVCGHLYIGGSSYAIDEIHGKDVKDKKYFEWIKNEAQVIFATYMIIQKGVSINRLDAGIDTTPRSDDEQLLGRVRRPFDDKRLPLWFTFHFKADYQLSKMAQKRIRNYVKDKSVELVRKDG